METLWIILALLCVIGGVIGCVLPFLPGPPLSFIALLIMKWRGAADFDNRFLWIWGGVAVVITALDYVLPGWLARRFGGSKYATTGSTIGLLVGLVFFPPFGLILGAFLGALCGELLYNRENPSKAVKVAMSAFVAFILGTGVKLGASLLMGYYVVRALFV